MSDPRFDDSTVIPGSVWPRIGRGMMLRCPNCGQGKLFRAYLKPVDHCENCGVAWGHIRADLAPAWAAMTLSAHLTVVIWHFFLWGQKFSEFVTIALLALIATVICLATLPTFKGMFMAILWSKGTTDS